MVKATAQPPMNLQATLPLIKVMNAGSRVQGLRIRIAASWLESTLLIRFEVPKKQNKQQVHDLSLQLTLLTRSMLQVGKFIDTIASLPSTAITWAVWGH